MDNSSKYDKYDNETYKRFSNPSLIEKDLQFLVGIIEGIEADTVINSKEGAALLDWVNERKAYEQKQPYKEIIDFIRHALDNNILNRSELDHILWFCNQYVKKVGYFTEMCSGIQNFMGIVKGIAIDKEVNIDEIKYLDDWMEKHVFLKNSYPYDEFYNLATNIIADKKISSEKQDEFLKFADSFRIDSVDTSNEPLMESLKTSYYQIDPQITIQGNSFCITGVSKNYKRKQIVESIELYGGHVIDNVSSKLGYLVICGEKNACWAFTCYGRKIEEAINLRKKGVNVAIVHEFDLFDTIRNLGGLEN